MCLFRYYTQKPNALRLLLLLMLSAVLCVFFHYDSPFLDILPNSLDSYVWLSISYDWLNGYIPYVDNFDHKGPLQYLINVVSLLFGVRMWGLVILNTLATAFILELVYRCGKLLKVPQSYNWWAIVMALLVLGVHDCVGNCTEQWSLPFQMLPLYLCLRYLRSDNKSVIVPALVSGLCFGAVAMIRLSNNFVIAAICITLCYFLIREKEWKKLLQCAVCFLIGLCVAVLPFFVYFAQHDALDEMIYCVFTFNFIYMADWCPTTWIGILKRACYLFPCVLLPILCWYRDKQTKEIPTALLYAVMGLVLIVSTSKGWPYKHYFILTLPIYVACIQFAYVIVSKKLRYAFFILLFFRPVVYGSWCVNNVVKYLTFTTDTNRHPGTAQQADYLYGTIPAEDLDSVYVTSRQLSLALTEQGHHPVGRYTFFQRQFAGKLTGAKERILEQFEKANPKWIVMRDEEANHELFGPYLPNYELVKTVQTCYQDDKETLDTFIIYRRKPIGE